MLSLLETVKLSVHVVQLSTDISSFAVSSVKRVVCTSLHCVTVVKCRLQLGSGLSRHNTLQLVRMKLVTAWVHQWSCYNHLSANIQSIISFSSTFICISHLSPDSTDSLDTHAVSWSPKRTQNVTCCKQSLITKSNNTYINLLLGLSDRRHCVLFNYQFRSYQRPTRQNTALCCPHVTDERTKTTLNAQLPVTALTCGKSNQSNGVINYGRPLIMFSSPPLHQFSQNFATWHRFIGNRKHVIQLF